MGHNEHFLGLKGDTILNKSSQLAIIASEHHVERLKAEPARGWLGDATIVEVDLHAEVPLERLAGCNIVIVEVDPSLPSSLDRIKEIRRRDADVAIVVAMQRADIGATRMLIRTGVSDVVALPLVPDEILQTCVAIAEVRKAREPAEVRSGDVITVVRALGRGGSTSVLTHLAGQLAGEGASVCIIDLDLQSGAAADYLGIAPKRTLQDLLDAGDRLDDAILQSVIEVDERGISLIAAPRELEPVETIASANIQRIIALAKARFTYVLVDLPRDLTNWSIGIISQADRMIMLAEQDVANLRQARRRIDLFRSLGFDLRLLSVVLNRTEKSLFKTIRVSDVERALGVKVAHTLSRDDPHLSTAQEQGMLIWELRRKSAFEKDMDQLAQALVLGLQNEKQA